MEVRLNGAYQYVMQIEIEGRQLESIQQELDVTQAKVIDCRRWHALIRLTA